MRKLSVCLLLFAATSLAQTADIGYFRAVMLPTNETPPTGVVGAKGIADIIAHVTRDSSGQITGGTVDFLVRVTLPTDNTAVGLHIHNGPAGVAAGVVINTGLSGSVTQAVKAGGDVVHRPAQVDGTNAAALAALRGMFTAPDQYYVNIHTTDFPNGIIRGQLQRAVGTVLMGVMSPDNEVPAVPVAASGMAVVNAIATVDPATGALTSAETYLSSTYKLGDSTTFTGFHIHNGVAGTNAGVIISSNIPAGTPVDPSGAGVIGPYYTEIDLTNAVQVATFNSLFTNPQANYINVHTNLHTGGIMRSQLRTTDTIVFPITLDSANEPGTIKLQGTAPTLITLHTLRSEDGNVSAGTVFFDVNYRFPSAATFTGLHIHDGGAGINGAISVPLVGGGGPDPNFSSDTGVGNFYDWTPGVLNLATLNDIVNNPENHYANIHSTLDPGGSARSQLAPVITAQPNVTAATSATLDKTSTGVAPGGLITIFGTNLVKVRSDLTGWVGAVLPKSLNAASVTIGGKSAAILFVSPTQINAQVPVDVALGQQAVVVKSTVGTSVSFNVNVTATAPAIFFSGDATAPVAAVLKNADFSVVGAKNPAKAGDVILVYCTGLGLTSANLPTGTLVTNANAATSATVTATIGSKPATVAYAIASPGFAGLYQVALTVPAGVTGNSAIVLTQGTTTSNAPSIPVQ
jgi:uncharacterized protein (TIGR03437 family)